MITQMIYHQGIVFLLAVLYGIVLTLIYEVVDDICRICFSNVTIRFLLYFTYFVFYLYKMADFMWKYDLGNLRVYSAVGFFLGILIYIFVFSVAIGTIICKILRIFSEFCKKIKNIICKPLKKIFKGFRLIFISYIKNLKQQGARKNG
ncbi:MAG: hypothetical protein IKN54_05755 [Lachnospiraceae bacterium]|nr:hypothetical protein [Lachnospiraceae bacterium]